jgi:hypothetical protein
MPISSQSNTVRGPFQIIGNSDLSACLGFLVKAVESNPAGTAWADLPSSQSDICIGVIVDADGEGDEQQVQPLTPDQEIRIFAHGTGAAGAVVVLAGTGQFGKVITLPAGAGHYFSPGVAMDDWVDGQLLRIRPLPRLVSVKAAQTQTGLTDSTGGTPSTTLAAITAGASYAQADLVAVKNAISSLAVELADIKTDVANLIGE